MNAQLAEKVAYKLLQEQASFTASELIASLVAFGCDAEKAPRMAEGVIRKLVLDGTVVEQQTDTGERYWVLSKKAEKELRKKERKGESYERGLYYEATTVIRLTLPAVAGSIPLEDPEPGKMVWPRDDQGRVILMPVWWKGMFRKVFEHLGQETNHQRYMADWLDFRPIVLDVQTGLMKIPVPPAGPGQRGQGVSTHETLPTGTTIEVHGLYPGGTVPQEYLARLWQVASWVGFSPGKSKLNYGTFEVLSINVVGVAQQVAD